MKVIWIQIKIDQCSTCIIQTFNLDLTKKVSEFESNEANKTQNQTDNTSEEQAKIIKVFIKIFIFVIVSN